MVDRDIVAGKVATIRDAIARIRQILPPDATGLAADRTAREIVALNLLVAIQESIDLAAHWIADSGLVVPGTQRELFERLAEQGIIPQQLASRLGAACGLRNVIAHQYGTVDWARVHSTASSNLGDLEALCEAAAHEAIGEGA